MKKAILFSVLSFMLVVTAACGKEEANKNQDAVQEEEESQEEKGVEVDKGLLNVEVTFPAFFFEDEEMDEVIAEAKADGVKEVTKNEDGSLTYKMSKSVYKELMKEMETNTVEYVDEIKDGEDFASIKDITYKKSFSEFTLVVDQEAYENSFDGFAILGLGMAGMYYQVFDGKMADELKVSIFVKDEASGEIFDTVVYPDDLQDEEEK